MLHHYWPSELKKSNTNITVWKRFLYSTVNPAVPQYNSVANTWSSTGQRTRATVVFDVTGFHLNKER